MTNPQHDADRQQNAGDLVLLRVAAGPWAGQEAAGDRADHRQEGRRAEMLVIDLSLRSTRTATLTTVNTHSSNSAVVPPSCGTEPTKVIRPNASSVVKAMAI